jgi:hypothetical protein
MKAYGGVDVQIHIYLTSALAGGQQSYSILFYSALLYSVLFYFYSRYSSHKPQFVASSNALCDMFPLN